MAVGLDKVVKLFLEQHDEEQLHERKIAAIQTLCKQNAAGFALRELPAVAQILEVTLHLISKGAAGFLEPACCLVRTLAKPYTKRSSTDELKLLGIITGLLKTLEAALQPGVPHQLQECTAELLAEFSSAYNNRPDVLEMGGTAAAAATADLQTALRLYHTHQSLLHQSSITPALCALLQAALRNPAESSTYQCSSNSSSRQDSSSPPATCRSGSGSRPSSASQPPGCPANSLVNSVVSALLNFSYSAPLCEQLLQHGVVQQLVRLLQALVNSESNQGTKLVNRIIEMLWNMLELAPATALQVLAAKSCQAVHNAPTTQQQIQLEEQQQGLPCSEDTEPPWPSCTESAAAADIWVRQSACPSCSTSRPATSAVAAAHTIMAIDCQAADKPPCSTAAAHACNGAAASKPASAGSGDGSADLPCNRTAVELVEVLSILFKQQLQDTSSKQAKEQRNDTLVVLQHLSRMPCCCAAVASSSFLPVAIAAATTPELQPSSKQVPAGALTKEEADHEMKLLLWSTLGNAAAGNGACLAAVAPALLRVLLLVLDESAGNSCFAVGRWNPEQLLALRKTAWSVLQQVTPLCKAEFCSCSGPKTLTRHISSCYSSNCSAEWTPRSCSSPSGRSHNVAAIAANTSLQASYVSGGAASFSARQSSSSIEPALRLLQRLVTGDAHMAEAFADQELIPALLQLLHAPICAEALGAKQGVLLALAEMCGAGGSNCTTKLRQAEGVGLLLKECQDVLESDPSQPSLVGLAALAALWRGILPSARSRVQLLALDGMDVLLTQLQRGNIYLRPVVLSVLADLLADKRAPPFFLEWHAPAAATGTAAAEAALSTSSALGVSASAGALGSPVPAGVTAAQLLISIWRGQDQARGLSGPDGLLANRIRPLAGSGSRTKWAVGEAGVAGGYGVLQPSRKAVLQRVAEASSPDLMLDKVYACFAELGFDRLAGSLEPADAAVLCFIRQYVKFRQGEVWQGITAEFEAAGVAPTQEDGLRIASGIQHAELIAVEVQQQQASLLASVKAGQLAAERAGYEAMLTQAAADAKSKVWQKDSSKLTMRERLAAKARREDMLKHSIASSIGAAVAAVPGATAAPAAYSAGGSGADAIAAGEATAGLAEASSRGTSGQGDRPSL